MYNISAPGHRAWHGSKANGDTTQINLEIGIFLWMFLLWVFSFCIALCPPCSCRSWGIGCVCVCVYVCVCEYFTLMFSGYKLKFMSVMGKEWGFCLHDFQRQWWSLLTFSQSMLHAPAVPFLSETGQSWLWTMLVALVCSQQALAQWSKKPQAPE